MLVEELITESLYMSMYDRQFDPAIDGGVVNTWLQKFNRMVDRFRDKIPYSFFYNYSNVDSLSNTSFVMVDDVSYIINKNVTSLTRVGLNDFIRLADVDNLIGYPSIYYFDDSTGTIKIYPSPSSSNYTFRVSARSALGGLKLSDEIPDNVPDFMKDVFIYELAFLICGEKGIPFNDKKTETRAALLAELRQKQIFDLTPQNNILFNIDQPNPYPKLYYLSGGK
jgi:hypothetical protein